MQIVRKLVGFKTKCHVVRALRSIACLAFPIVSSLFMQILSKLALKYFRSFNSETFLIAKKIWPR